MRFVALAVSAVFCTGCIIQNTVIADTVGVKGDVNTQVESVAVSPALGPPRATLPPQPNIGVVLPPTMMPPRAQVCDRDGPASPAEGAKFELGAYANKLIPNGWNAAYKSEYEVTARIRKAEMEDTVNWPCWQKFYPDATAVYLSIKDRPMATPIWQDIPVQAPVYGLVPVRDVQVSQASMVILTNRSQKVMATVRYADGSSDGNVMLSSDDTTIVAINATTGELTGTKPGVATIRATAANDPTKFALIQVTVREAAVEDLLATITPKEGKIDVGGTIQLAARLQDSNSNENANGNWISSNNTVARVNANGLVTGLKDGVVTITFRSFINNTVSATAQITVGNAPAQPEPSSTPFPETIVVSTTTIETSATTQ